MMNFKLKDRALLNADMIEPEIPYAVFSDVLVESVPASIVAELNHGSRVLDILRRYHCHYDLDDMAEMVREIKSAYLAYSREQDVIERRGWSKACAARQ